jgi:nucleotide-binding universal stress UspA family protein
LDGSTASEAVLPYAEQLAKSLSSELRLVHVLSGEHLIGDMLLKDPEALAEFEKYLRKTKNQIQRYLGRQRERLLGLYIPTRTAVVRMKADGSAQAIADYAEKQAADLIALTTHGLGGVERWLVGSVADRLLHTSRIPLLVVRPGGTAAQPEITSLLVPLDGSELAEGILAYVAPLARAMRLKVTLLRCVSQLTDAYIGAGYLGYTQLLEHEREIVARPYVGRVEAAAGRSIEAESEAQIGEASVTIADFAEKRPGTLIALSTHGRSGLGRWLLGSVADKVVRAGVAPVLLVRPAQEPHQVQD